jgi:hypothetical protein
VEGKNHGLLVEIADYIGNGRKMEDSKSVTLGSHLVQNEFCCAFQFSGALYTDFFQIYFNIIIGSTPVFTHVL